MPKSFLRNQCFSPAILPATVAVSKTSVMCFSHLCRGQPLLLFPLTFRSCVIFANTLCLLMWQKMSVFYALQNCTTSVAVYVICSTLICWYGAIVTQLYSRFLLLTGQFLLFTSNYYRFFSNLGVLGAYERYYFLMRFLYYRIWPVSLYCYF